MTAQVMDEEKKQKIINASIEEFSKGYSLASTNEIVRKAGVSKGLLFHYFGKMCIRDSQMNRVGSVKIAVEHAGVKAQGAVMASDAFFPFRDGIDVAAKAGVTAIIQPGGSIRDQESIDAANEHGMTMVFTGVRHFRH